MTTKFTRRRFVWAVAMAGAVNALPAFAMTNPFKVPAKWAVRLMWWLSAPAAPV